jgi:hypothetical protein
MTVLKRIAPLKERTHSAWLYIGVNDVTRLERYDGSVLGEEALALVMMKLSPDPSSHDFVTPPASCQPLYMDQAVRTLLLVAMPSMDDVGIAPIQRGGQSRGVQIPRAGTAGGAAPSPALSKGKGKVVRVIRSDDEVSSDDDVPMQRQLRACGRGRSTTDGPPPVAPASRPDLSAAAQATVPRGSSGSLAAGDTVAATRAATMKEATEATTAKEAAEEAAEKKKATEEAAKKKAVEEAAARKMVAKEAAAKKKATEEVAVKKKAAEEAAKKKAADEAAAKKASERQRRRSKVVWRLLASAHLRLRRQESRGWLRPVALQLRPSGDSTAPRSLATRPFICHFLYCICDFNLVSLAYNMPSFSRSPPTGGPASQVQPKLLSPRTPLRPN